MSNKSTHEAFNQAIKEARLISMQRERLNSLSPAHYCHKCGRRKWFSGSEPLTWSCIYCGNLIYYTYGKLIQQIDLVMASHRHREFVKSEDGRSILPVKNEDIKRIKFDKLKTGKRSKRKAA